MVLENFAVFEGIDGAGTTTQLNLLKERVSRQGGNSLPSADSFLFTAEPARTPVGAFIRTVLSGAAAVEPGALAYLFAADRFEHVYGKDGIMAAHTAGKAVICDRYFFSSLAYQGPACGAALPRKLNEDFPLPSLLFFFDIGVDEALARVCARGLREIFDSQTVLRRTADEYERVIGQYQARQEPGGMTVIRIDAALAQDEIHRAIWNALSTMPALADISFN
jgi:dTMP kinase